MRPVRLRCSGGKTDTLLWLFAASRQKLNVLSLGSPLAGDLPFLTSVRPPFWTVGLRCGPLWKGYEHGGSVLGTCFDLDRAAVQRRNFPNER